jgi:hypothetical protein
MDYFYQCAKEWFSRLVKGYETSKEEETCIDPETGLQLGVPAYIIPQEPGSPEYSQVSAEELRTLEGSPGQGARQAVVLGSEPRAKPLTDKEYEAIIAETTKPDATLKKDDSSDEETDEKDWVKEVISKESTKSYSESYSESIADLSNALSNMDTTALSAALNGESVDIQSLLRGGKSTKACQIIAKIMFNEQFGSARDIVSRGKANEQQMKEIWGDDITRIAKRNRSPCYLCTGKLVVPGGQAEMEHRMRCGEFYGIFAYIYSLYPKELAEWRYYVNRVADDDFKQNLLYYYNAINMATINEAELNAMYNNIIQQFKRDTGIIDTNGEYAKFTKLLRAYLHEFAYAHHVCNQIKCDHDLDNMKNVNNYYSVLDQYLAGVTPRDYTLPWNHMKINTEYSQAEKREIKAGLDNIDLNELKSRVVFQMELLKKFSRQVAEESGQTQKRMILRILKDALINMKDKKGSTDPSKRIIEQSKLLAKGDNFYNNDIVDALEFNKDLKLPEEKRDNRLVILFSKRLPRFLERIEIILENYKNGQNTLDIISKCLKSPFVLDNIREKILDKLNIYIRALTEINNKIDTIIIKYKNLLSQEDQNDWNHWNKIKTNLSKDLINLNSLANTEKKKVGALFGVEMMEMNKPEVKKETKSPGAQKVGPRINQSFFSTGRAVPTGVATFQYQQTGEAQRQAAFRKAEEKEENRQDVFRKAEEQRQMAIRRANTEKLAKVKKQKEDERLAALKIRRMEAKRLAAAEAIRLQAERVEAERQKLIQQNKDRDERVQAYKRAKLNGGRRQKVRTMRKIKGRPRKATMRVGRRKRTMKRKYVFRKKTRRR